MQKHIKRAKRKNKRSNIESDKWFKVKSLVKESTILPRSKNTQLKCIKINHYFKLNQNWY